MSTIYTRATKGSALTWTEGDANITNLNNDKLEDIVEDTTHQLGGDLDVGTHSIITSEEDGDITLAPDGTGAVILVSEVLGLGVGSSPAFITTADNTSDLELNTNGNSANSKIVLSAGANGNIEITPNGTGSVVLDGQSWPQAAPASDGEYLEALSDGTLAWTDSVKAKTIYENVKNVSGGSLAKGTPVTQVGVTGAATVTVEAARADDPTKLAIGVLNETLADDDEGKMIVLGEIKGVNTSGFTVGDKVYLGATGGFTNVKPTATDVAVQFLGVVFRVDASTGSGFITGTLVEDSVRWTGTVFQFWDGTDWVSAGGGATTLDALTDVTIASVADGDVLVYNGTSSQWENTAVTGGLDNVVEDTTPQLGGNLDVNGQSIVSVSNGNILLEPNGTGQTIVKNLEYQEFVHALGTTSGTIAPNAANGNVQTITLNGNLTINAFTSPVSGQTITLIITTGGTGRTLTSSMLFAGASKTLSTTSTTDILTMSYIGTTYYASLVKGYA